MMEIRSYQEQDYDQLVALYKNKRAYGGNFDTDRDEANKLRATAANGNLYVAADGGIVKGTYMILDNPHTFWLLRFAVYPESDNAEATAAELFAHACAIATERGHASVIVYTDADDPTLNARYEALGCHKADIYRCYWKETN